MADPSAAAMAAAVAAAAELAKSGSLYLFAEGLRAKANENLAATPFIPDMSQRNATSNQISSNHVSQATLGGLHSCQTLEETREEVSSPSGEEDAEKRLARSRERNREHARRTRLRKKAQLESLQERVKGLEAESRVLKQSIEECSIASILIGLSSGDSPTDTALDEEKLDFEVKDTPKVSLVITGKRKRFLTEETAERTPQPLKLNIDGHVTLIGGGKSHINWKSGVYCDENGVQQQLTKAQLESLRRERNRLHAKMTRDRKKNFVSHVEKTIEKLENENQRMRDVLSKVAEKFSKTVTPTSSPSLTALPTSPVVDNAESAMTQERVDGGHGSNTPSLQEEGASTREEATLQVHHPPTPHGFHLIA